MATEGIQEILPKPATPTFCETLNYYFSMENALYEEKVRDANSETAHLLQRVVDGFNMKCFNGPTQKALGRPSVLLSATSKTLKSAPSGSE